MSRGRILPGHRVVGPPPGKRPSELEDSTVAASTGENSVTGNYQLVEHEVIGIKEGVHSSIPDGDIVEPSGLSNVQAAPPGVDEDVKKLHLSGVPPPDESIKSPPTPSKEAETVEPSKLTDLHASVPVPKSPGATKPRSPGESQPTIEARPVEGVKPDDSIVQADRARDGYLSGRDSVEPARNSERLRSSPVSPYSSGPTESKKEKRTRPSWAQRCNIV